MKHRIGMFFALALVLCTAALVLCTAALAQDAARSVSVFSQKAVSILGTVSDDGKFFVAETDSNVWTVVNPESVKAQRGQEVTLQGQLNRIGSEIRVLHIKPRGLQITSMANFGDSAFRR